MFLAYNLLDEFSRDGFNIGSIGEARIRHDGGWVAVDKHDRIPLFVQYLARLCTRIVELARLSDNNWTRTDDENRLDISPSRHD